VVTVDVVADVAVAAVEERPRYAEVRLGDTNCRKLTIGAGEGMAARYQAWSSRKGWQDQEHGGDVRLPQDMNALGIGTDMLAATCTLSLSRSTRSSTSSCPSSRTRS
jgi:hypothetical protein